VVADTTPVPAEECERTAQWVLEKFADVGFSDAHLEETADGSMAVVGIAAVLSVGRPPCCSTPTTTCSRRSTMTPGAPPVRADRGRRPLVRPRDGRLQGQHRHAPRALRALGDRIPVDLKLVVEGSEEQGTGGLEAFVPSHADLLRADTILVCDTGNAAVGHPAATVSLRGMVNVVVTVEASSLGDHSGMFGGAAPDASLRWWRCWHAS
jgi:acetylornithine deacetylase/succinyl-diaminopimelate desuccinylase-like protein